MRAFVIVCFFVAAAQAAPSSKELDRVLGGIERVAGPEDVRRLGSDADRVLIAVASDGRTSRLRRMRAILALQHAPTMEALDFLRAVLAEEGAAIEGPEVLDVAAALSALAPHGREVLSDLLPFLTHHSADVRQSAAAALAATRAPEAAAALRARVVVERDMGVRGVVLRALRGLDAR